MSKHTEYDELSQGPVARERAEYHLKCLAVDNEWRAMEVGDYIKSQPQPAPVDAMRDALEYIANEIEGTFPLHELVEGGDNSFLGDLRDRARTALAAAKEKA